MGDNGAQLALQLLDHWSGQSAQTTSDWQAQLAGWQQWYAKHFPGAPPAELPVDSGSDKWSYDELLAFLRTGSGRAGDPARGEAACSECHVDAAGAWNEAVPMSACSECHTLEHQGFLASRHGMRIAESLSPMRPDDARRPMSEEAFGRDVDCNACHGSHLYDRHEAAADACLACHADEHSLAWEASPHAALWRAEVAGTSPEGSGVSCATCHLPTREERASADPSRLRVDAQPERLPATPTTR